MQTNWRDTVVQKWLKKKMLSLPMVGTPSQARWVGPAERQKRRHPTWSRPPSAPLLLFPGPMEGQAVPTGALPGLRFNPTIHPNPPPHHPLHVLPPQPWHSAWSALPSPAQAIPLPSPPRRAGACPGPSEHSHQAGHLLFRCRAWA